MSTQHAPQLSATSQRRDSQEVPVPVAETTQTFLGMPAFPSQASRAVNDTQLRANLRHATGTIRGKRAQVVSEVDGWEDLRSQAAAIKDDVLANLDSYLLQLEESLRRAGAHVHWARDAAEANRIVADIVKAKGEQEVVKVKSMATQEIELNEALEAEGITAWETDLAELIVQLGHDRPSHILVPAIHKNRAEIREIFSEEMGQVGKPAPANLSAEPSELADAARQHLREKFLRAEVAICGANFAIAETGTLVVVESEGNGRMCLTLPETLISVVGIEKVLPSWDALSPMMELLPRSSTGERMNPYTSMWSGSTEGDGPDEVHVVLVDNGRTHVLADGVGREALRCIRCSACLNVCPVYERTGGHAYTSVYPGPIGAILTPQLRGMASERDKALPFASSLCGACSQVCPVKIDFPKILVELRAQAVEEKRSASALPSIERTAIAGAKWALGSGVRMDRLQHVATLASKALGERSHLGNIPGPLSRWSSARDIPAPPKETFRQWWERTDGGRDPGECSQLDGRARREEHPAPHAEHARGEGQQA